MVCAYGLASACLLNNYQQEDLLVFQGVTSLLLIGLLPIHCRLVYSYFVVI